MSACRYCGADVERMDRHYAAEPDAGGCKIVALAFSPDYWPYLERNESAEVRQRRAAGVSSARARRLAARRNARPLAKLTARP